MTTSLAFARTMANRNDHRMAWGIRVCSYEVFQAWSGSFLGL